MVPYGACTITWQGHGRYLPFLACRHHTCYSRVKSAAFLSIWGQEQFCMINKKRLFSILSLSQTFFAVDKSELDEEEAVQETLRIIYELAVINDGVSEVLPSFRNSRGSCFLRVSFRSAAKRVWWQHVPKIIVCL